MSPQRMAYWQLWRGIKRVALWRVPPWLAVAAVILAIPAVTWVTAYFQAKTHG